MKVDAGDEGAGSRVRSTLAEINVVPLVDVVLVLLLIFMLTAPMMERGFEVDLPEASAEPAASDEEQLVLTITRDRAVFLDDQEVPAEGLEAGLAERMRDRTDKAILIRADSGLLYGYVVEMMDRVRRAGVEKVGIVTEPEAGPGPAPGPVPGPAPGP